MVVVGGRSVVVVNDVAERYGGNSKDTARTCANSKDMARTQCKQERRARGSR